MVVLGCTSAAQGACASEGDCVGGGAGGARPASDTQSQSTGFTLAFDASIDVVVIPACPADASVDAFEPPADASTGCEGIEGGVDYTTQVAPIVGCTGELCHSPWTAATLVNQRAAECCDGRSLVMPGNAAESYLIDKVTGTNLCAGGQMPLFSTPLADAQVQTLSCAGFCEGAPTD